MGKGRKLPLRHTFPVSFYPNSACPQTDAQTGFASARTGPSFSCLVFISPAVSCVEVPWSSENAGDEAHKFRVAAPNEQAAPLPFLIFLFRNTAGRTADQAGEGLL